MMMTMMMMVVMVLLIKCIHHSNTDDDNIFIQVKKRWNFFFIIYCLNMNEIRNETFPFEKIRFRFFFSFFSLLFITNIDHTIEYLVNLFHIYRINSGFLWNKSKNQNYLENLKQRWTMDTHTRIFGKKSGHTICLCVCITILSMKFFFHHTQRKKFHKIKVWQG